MPCMWSAKEYPERLHGVQRSTKNDDLNCTKRTVDLQGCGLGVARGGWGVWAAGRGVLTEWVESDLLVLCVAKDACATDCVHVYHAAGLSRFVSSRS